MPFSTLSETSFLYIYPSLCSCKTPSHFRVIFYDLCHFILPPFLVFALSSSPNLIFIPCIPFQFSITVSLSLSLSLSLSFSLSLVYSAHAKGCANRYLLNQSQVCRLSTQQLPRLPTSLVSLSPLTPFSFSFKSMSLTPLSLWPIKGYAMKF